MFIILASIFLFIFILAFTLIYFASCQIDKKKVVVSENSNSEKNDQNKFNLKISEESHNLSQISHHDEDQHLEIEKKRLGNEVSLKMIFASLQFYQVFLSAWILALAGLFTTANFKTLGLELGFDDKFLTLVGSVGSVLNGVLRPFWGLSMDKSSYRLTNTVIACIQIVICFTFPFIEKINVCFLIWIAVLYSCVGGVNTQLVPISIKIYGPVTGIRVFSFLILSMGFCNLTLYLIQIFAVESIGDRKIFFAFGGICGIAGILSAFIKEKYIG